MPASREQVHRAGLTKSQERIYSAHQLVQALKSALAAVRDQLGVLTILDSSASSWPGLQQAMDDLEFLVDMSGQTTGRMEKENRDKEEQLRDIRDECTIYKETLGLQNQQKEELQQRVGQLDREVKQLTAKLDTASKEVAQQKQELWTLEKQRADLASEMERVKQDNDFMEGEINTLRATVTEQMQQVTTLKEEAAARKVDVSHLKQLSTDQKGQIDHLKRTLDGSTQQLRDCQQQLNQVTMDKTHHEKEASRLQEEAAHIGVELTKTSKELQRLKEWQDVLKKVEADKLREEQAARSKDRLELEAAKAALDKALASTRAQLANREEQVQARAREVLNLQKQLGLAGVQTKDLQKQVAVLTSQKVAADSRLQEANTSMAKMQAHVQALQLAAAQADSSRLMQDGKVREVAAADRAKLQAAVEEGSREAAVQRALAEGWARDLRATQARLQEEQAMAARLQAQVSDMVRDHAIANSSRDDTKLPNQITKLHEQVAGMDKEIQRLKVDYASEKKRLEKQIESLQRECNESAIEVDRLRDGQAMRLPQLTRPITIQDELADLKRMLHSMPGRVPHMSSGHVLGDARSLPALVGTGRVQLTR